MIGLRASLFPPIGMRLIDSVPPATTTWAAPVWISWAARAMAWSPDEQNRLMVMAPAVYGTPARRAACRATFIPCSASGMAQPSTTSSTIAGFTIGTRWRAPRMASAAMSSGRVSRRVPRPALPTAVRTLETITASRMSTLVAPLLVPERLALFQHELDSLLGLLRAEEGQESLALEVQVVLLARQSGRTVTPAEDGGHVGGHRRVVLADVAAAGRVQDPHLEGGEGAAARHRHVGAGPAGAMTRPREGEGDLLRVCEQAIRVRGDGIGGGEEHVLRFGPRGGGAGKGDEVEGPLQERQRIDTGEARGAVVGTKGQLLRPTAAGDDSHSDLDQAHVGLGGQAHPRRGHPEIATA